jgi:hypothetical protein
LSVAFGGEWKFSRYLAAMSQEDVELIRTECEASLRTDANEALGPRRCGIGPVLPLGKQTLGGGYPRDPAVPCDASLGDETRPHREVSVLV